MSSTQRFDFEAYFQPQTDSSGCRVDHVRRKTPKSKSTSEVSVVVGAPNAQDMMANLLVGNGTVRSKQKPLGVLSPTIEAQVLRHVDRKGRVVYVSLVLKNVTRH